MFTNSPLVNYTQISPCKTENRGRAIDTITIHCYVGQVSVERMGSGWSKTSANSSANYGIGSDGRIGLYVDEKDRAWTTGGIWKINGISGSQNDYRAVTIECACDTTSPYAINDKVMESLIKLVADIAKRNNIKEILWKGDKKLVGKPNEQTFTVHRWFASKSCPGDYIYNRLDYIAREANKILNGEETEQTVFTINYTVVKGDSLSKIASRYSTTVTDIMAVNPSISNPNKIKVGQTIKIPVNRVPRTYTVVSGDTLSKIGQKVGIAWRTIATINGIASPYTIHVGQVLKLE